MQEHSLLSVRQHKMKLFFRMPRWIGFGILAGFFALLFADYAIWAGVLGFLAVLALGVYLEWNRFVRSTLEVTNLRVYLSVMKGFTSGFEAGLHYRQIKNCAFRKEHLIHTLTNSGTLYLRAGGDEKEQIAAEYVPNVERVCRAINWLLALSEEKRVGLESLPEGVV
ncbi:MAG: hypothetical protein ACOYN2_03020 [Patescibacteria group bacterium]